MRRRSKTSRARRAAAATLVAAALLGLAGTAPAARAVTPVTMTNYTDPAQALRWGDRSHWKQPWRSYLDTVPATTLLDAIGINFNVGAKLAPATARLLADSGFKRARIEVGWGSLEYGDPGRIEPSVRRNLVTTLTALRENGIRPLILLNANSGQPCPTEQGTVELAEPAAAGDTEIHLAPEGLAAVTPGRTGIDSEGIAAGVLFKSVAADGAVQLSKPLPTALPAGPLPVVTLRYEPFRPAKLADGEPNPAFGPTLRGWLEYVGTVSREVKSILGSEEFDVEIWNELSFGSQFLDIDSYYEPNLEWEKNGNLGQILFRTVEYLRDPAHGTPNIGIGNGFSDESPFWSGSTSPPGLTAIDKHPYAGWKSFPEDAQVNGNRPLNGLGEPAGWKDAEGQYHETFTPTYDAFFPEFFLSGIQTETLVHDLSPLPSLVQGAEHGLDTHPPGAPPPAVWVTEANLAPGSGPTPRSEMSAADIRHIETKDVLRYLVAYVNKGVTALDFYAADAGDLSLIDPGFFKAVKAAPTSYPGDAAGGETTDAVRRLAAALGGAEPIASPRRLALSELTDFSGGVQFEGNGTAAYPPLFNREVFAFLPFQVSSRRFVIPVYVMTRNVAEVYGGSGPGRFDLPPETYRLAIEGVNGDGATVSASDPLTGATVPVAVISRSPQQVVVQLPVTDSPRLLTIQEQPLEPEPEEPPEPAPAAEPASEGPAGEAVPKAPGEAETEAAEATATGRGAEVPGNREEAAGRRAPGPAPAGGEPAGATLDPILRLEGGATLLSRGRMTALTRCRSRCLVGVSARVLIAGHSYPLLATAAAGAPTPVAVELSIGPRASRRGRLALRRHARVAIVVTARVRAIGGGAEAVSRRVVLRG